MAITAFAILEYLTFKSPDLKAIKNTTRIDKLTALNVGLDELENENKKEAA